MGMADGKKFKKPRNQLVENYVKNLILKVLSERIESEARSQLAVKQQEILSLTEISIEEKKSLQEQIAKIKTFLKKGISLELLKKAVLEKITKYTTIIKT